MVEQTGCAAVQIGRAAIANPWIFAGRNGAPLRERLRLAVEQLRLMVQYKGERVGVPETRKHLVHYFRDLEKGSPERTRLLTTPSLGDLIQFLETWQACRGVAGQNAIGPKAGLVSTVPSAVIQLGAHAARQHAPVN